jgi:septal ring factor EnvC (AmiA/AmiB activator)
VGESVFYRNQIYRYRVKEMENTTQALKEARAMIATLKKGRRKDKAKIRELSEVIQEQNFLLQHNDQYMLELENQLEAIAAPPPEPVIPRKEEEEDAEEIQGESGVEFGPASL